MKYIYLLLFSLIFPACGTQQYGTTEINRCPSCRNFAIEVQNFHPTTQVIKIDEVVVELEPKKTNRSFFAAFIDLFRKESQEVIVPIDSAQVANRGYAMVTLEYGGYTEEMKMWPGIGNDLRPWMFHIADIQYGVKK
jgi:hypothetical protein